MFALLPVNAACFRAHYVVKKGEEQRAGREPAVWSHKILMDSERKREIKIPLQARPGQHGVCCGIQLQIAVWAAVRAGGLSPRGPVREEPGVLSS